MPQGDDAVLLRLHAARDCQLELWGLRDKARAVERTLGRRLEVEVIRPEGTGIPGGDSEDEADRES